MLLYILKTIILFVIVYNYLFLFKQKNIYIVNYYYPIYPLVNQQNKKKFY